MLEKTIDHQCGNSSIRDERAGLGGDEAPTPHPQSYEEIGRMAERVAHDLTNSLSASLMHLGFLHQSPGLSTDARTAIEEIVAEATRAARLTRQLLLLSRQQTGRLPLVLKPRNANEPQPQALSVPQREGGNVCGGSETILLVEDELALRRMMALNLRKLGYAVLEAGEVTEALELWRRHHQEIALLLTDVDMPGARSGFDLACDLAAEDPGLKIIVSTGHDAAAEGGSTPAGLVVTRLPKPCEPPILAQIVRHCLDSDECAST